MRSYLRFASANRLGLRLRFLVTRKKCSTLQYTTTSEVIDMLRIIIRRFSLRFTIISLQDMFQRLSDIMFVQLVNVVSDNFSELSDAPSV